MGGELVSIDLFAIRKLDNTVKGLNSSLQHKPPMLGWDDLMERVDRELLNAGFTDRLGLTEEPHHISGGQECMTDVPLDFHGFTVGLKRQSALLTVVHRPTCCQARVHLGMGTLDVAVHAFVLCQLQKASWGYDVDNDPVLVELPLQKMFA